MKKIEDVSPEDEVPSWDPETKTFQLSRVDHVIIGKHKELVTIRGDNWSFTCTFDHRFLSGDGLWVPAAELRVGDSISTCHYKQALIMAVERQSLTADVTVYNLEIKKTHNYCVTNMGLVAHNLR